MTYTSCCRNLAVIVKTSDTHSECNTWINSSSFCSNPRNLLIYYQLLQQSQFWPKYLLFNLITDLLVCFISQNRGLFRRDVNKEVLFKNIKLFNNSQQNWRQSEPFNMFQKFMCRQAKLP